MYANATKCKQWRQQKSLLEFLHWVAFNLLLFPFIISFSYYNVFPIIYNEYHPADIILSSKENRQSVVEVSYKVSIAAVPRSAIKV